MDPRKLAGVAIILGATQFLLALLVAESISPGYLVSSQPISDLGVGSTSWLFNISVIVAGLTTVIAAWLVKKAFGDLLVPGLLAIAGIGMIGVGLFPETTGGLHVAASVIAFAFAPLAMIASYRLVKGPASYYSAVMGIISLGAAALFQSGATMGLGNGGMERMIVYPFIAWALVAGGYLMGTTEVEAPSGQQGKKDGDKRR